VSRCIGLSVSVYVSSTHKAAD